MDQVVLTLDQIKSLALKFILEGLVWNCRSIREKWREKWSDEVVGHCGSWWSWGRWWHCWLITVVRCIFAILPICCILLLFIVCLCITQQKIKFQLNSNENIFLNESLCHNNLCILYSERNHKRHLKCTWKRAICQPVQLLVSLSKNKADT